jgi:hypothetical protein
VGLRSRSLSLVIAFVLLVAPQLARAETGGTPLATQTAIASTCGETIDEKLAAAQKELQSDNTDIRKALTCLTEATADIRQTTRSCDADRSQSKFLHVVPREESFAPQAK